MAANEPYSTLQKHEYGRDCCFAEEYDALQAAVHPSDETHKKRPN